MFKRLALGAAMAVAATTAAEAAIIVDGAYDAIYGASTATVFHNPAAPTSNFGTPTNENHNVGYRIYLNGSSSHVYGLIQATGPTNSLTFANVYFDLDNALSPGSNLGFELDVGAGNQRAFIPNNSALGTVTLSGIQVAESADGSSLEFAIPVKYFTGKIAGLTYDAGVTMPSIGDKVQLRLSQSFGYSVAGGETYGADRLGEVSLTPEPSAWAMMIMGFGAAGAMMRRRRAVAA